MYFVVWYLYVSLMYEWINYRDESFKRWIGLDESNRIEIKKYETRDCNVSKNYFEIILYYLNVILLALPNICNDILYLEVVSRRLFYNFTCVDAYIHDIYSTSKASACSVCKRFHSKIKMEDKSFGIVIYISYICWTL